MGNRIEGFDLQIDYELKTGEEGQTLLNTYRNIAELREIAVKSSKVTYNLAGELSRFSGRVYTEDIELTDFLDAYGDRVFHTADIISDYLAAEGVGTLISGVLGELKARPEYYAKEFDWNNSHFVKLGAILSDIGVTPANEGKLFLIILREDEQKLQDVRLYSLDELANRYLEEALEYYIEVNL